MKIFSRLETGHQVRVISQMELQIEKLLAFDRGGTSREKWGLVTPTFLCSSIDFTPNSRQITRLLRDFWSVIGRLRRSRDSCCVPAQRVGSLYVRGLGPVGTCLKCSKFCFSHFCVLLSFFESTGFSSNIGLLSFIFNIFQ